ncbi:transcription initiation factor IIA small subunit [Beauveria brongniartii RCEF 3172]|uniref:Transcription initiation factor IIA small subunit n=1 Tax=Beauveria brongniartii RCEF 3172 TaxID=1081107 RepID=A0A167C6B5_9HYPO|nr:transcription initiation factor IIA small subunit [Beauveria brongniartii RCEF 3172]
MIRQRRKPASDTTAATTRSKQPTAASSSNSSSSNEPMTTTTASAPPSQWSTRTQWIVFAIASGVCAAFNGAFAKLTTAELTTSLSNGISNLVGLSEYKPIVEYVVRAMFFILNLAFNGVMWSLFTTALARGTSATQVSIMNTSSNFIVTAMLGIAVFSEKLPPLWWAGAALLVVGNVITGRKNDGDEVVDADATGEAEPLIIPENDDAAQEEDESAYKDDEDDEDVPDIPVQ